jgi:hypothetical protein
MEPVGVWVRKDGGWELILRCTVCGKLESNPVAADDNPMKLLALAMKPFANPILNPEGLNNLCEKLEN